MVGFRVFAGISVAAGLLAAAATPAQATAVAYSAGFATPARVIDFSGLVDNTVIGSAYAGVTFSGLYANSSQGNTLPPTTAPAAVNYSGSTTNSPFKFTFATPQSDVVFFLYTDGYGATITSSLAGTVIESVSAGSYNTSGTDFFGFTGSSFDTITVSVTGVGGVANSGLALIDNVEIGKLASQVPEPGSNAIMLVGLAALMMIGGRRRI